jgi:hypothetical protein
MVKISVVFDGVRRRGSEFFEFVDGVKGLLPQEVLDCEISKSHAARLETHLAQTIREYLDAVEVVANGNSGNQHKRLAYQDKTVLRLIFRDRVQSTATFLASLATFARMNAKPSSSHLSFSEG